MSRYPKMNKSAQTAQTNSKTEGSRSCLKSILCATCCYYTVFSLVMVLVTALASGSFEVGVYSPKLLLLLPLSAAIATSQAILGVESISRGVRYFLHPVLCLGAAYLCIILPYQLEQASLGRTVTPAQLLLFVLAAAVVYGVAVLIRVLLRGAMGKRREAETPYESQFGKR